MGYGIGQPAIGAMNAEHDDTHRRLRAWLGIRSTSLMIARGEPVTKAEQELAWAEEHAACAVQRFIQHARNAGEI